MKKYVVVYRVEDCQQSSSTRVERSLASITRIISDRTFDRAVSVEFLAF